MINFTRCLKLSLDYLIDKFGNVYMLDKDITGDAELLFWKGRLEFKKYIANKRAKFRIKLFPGCDVNDYLWSSFLFLK